MTRCADENAHNSKPEEPIMQPPLHPSTVAVTAGRGDKTPGDPTNVPVNLSSTFHPGGENVYGRHANPNWSALEEVLGALEGGRALVYSSGMGAISAVLELLPVGSGIVMPFDAYYGARKFVYEAAEDGRLSFKEVDVSDRAAVLEACAGAELLWLESPTNPLMNIADVAVLAEGAHERGALVVMDSTFATPLLQRPLDLGVDVVVHSATKYISGHSDVLLGVAVTRDDQTFDELLELRSLYGAIAGPMESWLALRGLRTLPLRLERAQANAGEIALSLDAHPLVERVRYPGLPDDPGHEVAARQMRGFGAMVCFEVADAAVADQVMGGPGSDPRRHQLGGTRDDNRQAEQIRGRGGRPRGVAQAQRRVRVPRRPLERPAPCTRRQLLTISATNPVWRSSKWAGTAEYKQRKHG
jgi:cystathionine gamma-synthase